MKGAWLCVATLAWGLPWERLKVKPHSTASVRTEEDSFYNDLGEFADSEEQARLDALEQESTKKKRRLRKALLAVAGVAAGVGAAKVLRGSPDLEAPPAAPSVSLPDVREGEMLPDSADDDLGVLAEAQAPEPAPEPEVPKVHPSWDSQPPMDPDPVAATLDEEHSRILTELRDHLQYEQENAKASERKRAREQRGEYMRHVKTSLKAFAGTWLWYVLNTRTYTPPEFDD